ncbi:MAG: hypothetical protein ACRC57_13775 [Sarcina sp.]
MDIKLEADIINILDKTNKIIKEDVFMDEESLELKKELEHSLNQDLQHIDGQIRKNPKYISLGKLTLEHKAFLSTTDTKNIEFLKTFFIKVIDKALSDINACYDKIDAINMESIKKYIDINPDDIYDIPDSDIDNNKERLKIQKLIDTPAMLKVKSVLKLLSFDSELFVGFLLEDKISACIQIFEEHIDARYFASNADVDIIPALKDIKNTLVTL